MKRRHTLATAGLSIAQLWAAQAIASPEDDSMRFLGTYNYCDASILAGHWNVSTGDAKIRGGAKMGANATRVLEDALRSGRNARNFCGWSDTGFTYEDAQALAELWKISVEDAKSALAEKLTGGYRNLAARVVAEAHGAGKKPAKPGKLGLKPVKPGKPVNPVQIKK